MNFEKFKSQNVLLGQLGNKKNEYHKYLKNFILNNINKDTLFIEPFCGSGIISYNLYFSNNIKTHINDIENFRIKFYNECKDLNFMKKINDVILSINNEDDFKKIIDRKKIKIDYENYYYSRIIQSFRPGLYDKDRRKKEINFNWNEFLNNTIITNEDWTLIIEKYKDDENAFIFLDPPYLDSYNKAYSNYNGQKLNKDNTTMYIEILDYLKNCKCKLLVTINSNAITHFLYKDYIKLDYNCNYNYTHLNKEQNYKNFSKILILSNF